MDRMLVVVFDNEKKAYEGQKVLLDLAKEGSISLYAHVVLVKNSDGTTSVRREDGFAPLGTFAGTAFGSFVGLLGGPIGVLVGAAAGAFGGSLIDLKNARIGSDFIDDVNVTLSPNHVAVVAEIEEDWTTPVDSRMEAIGGKVLRRSLSEVTDTVNAEELEAMKADYAQLKAEYAKSQAENQTRLKEKMNRLDAKIQAHLQRNKEHRVTVEREARAKADMLKTRVRPPREAA